MKILVLGLDCAAPEILLQDKSLRNFQKLMEIGFFGKLESIIPPITVPAWMCMSTSQDPGSLGVYGFRNRMDHTYAPMQIATSKSIQELAVWDQVAREGKRSIIIGVPPSYPPRKTNGICVGCFMTPDPTVNDFTFPVEIKNTIAQIVDRYPVDVKGFRTDNKTWLKEQVFEMSRKQFDLVRHLLQNESWDYFHFVDIGLDRIQHGFWQFHDTNHIHYEPGNPYENVVLDYYAHLDEQLGKIFGMLDDETAILVVSDHGAQRLDGGFCINEWLVKQGLLVLNQYPAEITPFSQLDVNWEKTRVWSEGGYYARIFINMKNREPAGIINQNEYESFRENLRSELETLAGPDGKPLGNLVFKPEEIYQTVRNIAPDLIVHFGGLYWRSIGSVGHASLFTTENDTGPDGCNHAQFGAFILAGPRIPDFGELNGVHLLDIAPTLLELGGYDIPATMQGNSLLGGIQSEAKLSVSDEQILRERLSGLGYIE